MTKSAQFNFAVSNYAGARNLEQLPPSPPPIAASTVVGSKSGKSPSKNGELSESGIDFSLLKKRGFKNAMDEEEAMKMRSSMLLEGDVPDQDDGISGKSTKRLKNTFHDMDEHFSGFLNDSEMFEDDELDDDFDEGQSRVTTVRYD